MAPVLQGAVHVLKKEWLFSSHMATICYNLYLGKSYSTPKRDIKKISLFYDKNLRIYDTLYVINFPCFLAVFSFLVPENIKNSETIAGLLLGRQPTIT